jgi:hypothetical protein
MPFLWIGCKDSGSYKPNITGKMGEVMIVMDEKTKKSAGGEYLIEMFKQEMQGLPQIESIFDLSVIPPTILSDHMKTWRNMLIVTISPDVETEGVMYYTDNAWAKEQALMRIEAKNYDTFQQLVEKYEVRILGFFMSAERNRILTFNRQYPNVQLMDDVKNTWGFEVGIPNGYRKNKPRTDKNFRWFSQESSSTSEALMIYSFEYIGEGTFSREYLLNKRDSVLRVNVPGAVDGSYMATELNLPVTYKSITINGHQAVELRGLWKVVGDLMGGSFVMYAHHDKKNNRVIVTDGYVYAPEKPNKRNLVWQVESLHYSVKFAGDKEVKSEELKGNSEE